MDSVALWFNEEDEHVERITRRILRDRSDILSPNDNRCVFVVLNVIQHNLIVPKRSTAIPTAIKVAAALKLLGKGGYQHQIGQDHLLGSSQQSMSRSLKEVCMVIERILCPKHIKFDVTAAEENEIKKGSSQQSMSRSLKEVCMVIERILCPKHIKFDVTAAEENEIKKVIQATSWNHGCLPHTEMQRKPHVRYSIISSFVKEGP
ncbi:hypothetical protein DOY81_011073 [Sarcophaga bullata]|nr:hypothetical protein DOY81_011073 [Sarcophaga bullata]